MNAEEYSKWKNSQGEHYVGIGMEIVKNKTGQVICIPFKESPAEQAGIHAGDELIAIDGLAIKGQSILMIGNMARGDNK
jgi:carboxyl-terminal processing protease